MESTQKLPIMVIVGLGNPGPKFSRTRHNIGFMVLDALAAAHGGQWQSKERAEVAQIVVADRTITLIKPQTFMNSSGLVMPALAKKGIKPEQILVVHDELELPFGKLKIKSGGSAKGHNGLRSIIEHIGDAFPRLCFGIARPAHKDDVPHYVLQPFNEPEQELERHISEAVHLCQKTIS